MGCVLLLHVPLIPSNKNHQNVEFQLHCQHVRAVISLVLPCSSIRCVRSVSETLVGVREFRLWKSDGRVAERLRSATEEQTAACQPIDRATAEGKERKRKGNPAHCTPSAAQPLTITPHPLDTPPTPAATTVPRRHPSGPLGSDPTLPFSLFSFPSPFPFSPPRASRWLLSPPPLHAPRATHSPPLPSPP